MKSLVLYYSYEENCQRIAENIRTVLKADMIRLKLKHEERHSGLMKYLWGGQQVVMHRKPPLEPVEIAFDGYDLIFIGSPVWAFSYAPAFETFFSGHRIQGKKIALFCCSGGGKGKVFDRFRKHLEGNEILGEKEFVEPLKKDADAVARQTELWIGEVLKKLPAETGVL